MQQGLYKLIKIGLVVIVLATIFAGHNGSSVSMAYPLESVSEQGQQVSRVYRAAGETVPDVAKKLADQRKPDEISKEDPERMFLVYPDQLYHLQRDPENPDDTLIEVDNKEFVRHNYNSSFLEGYLVASIFNSLLDSFGSDHGTYRGYSQKDANSPSYHTPTKAEKKQAPPLTVEKKGSILKRGSDSSRAGTSIGSDESIFKKKSPAASSGGVGTITRSSGSSGSTVDTEVTPKKSKWFSPPRNNSPPKTKVGGFGRIKRR
ncbi:DUF4247 domain-containing protein [Brevibacillus sp. B_LB10_24]|uniref:DUF4247 domain-containing protein n=1 Tax=Brevibacillus sp. B_LB10_24 TaxID=3380645 RepID=UPI0038BBF192